MSMVKSIILCARIKPLTPLLRDKKRFIIIESIFRGLKGSSKTLVLVENELEILDPADFSFIPEEGCLKLYCFNTNPSKG